MAQRQPAPEPTDPAIVVTDDERRDFRKRREGLELSTRALAKLAKTSNATVTNIEGGTQRTLKRSTYVALVRILYRTTAPSAEERADDAIARSDAAVKRLARALAGFSAEQVEAMALGAEAMSKRTR